MIPNQKETPSAPQIFLPYFGTPECDDPRKLIVPIDSISQDPENANKHPSFFSAAAFMFNGRGI